MDRHTASGEAIDGLRRAILSDAREMARAEIRQAEQLSQAEQERARQEAEAERARILREAGREAEAIRRQATSSAQVATRLRMLEAREKLIQEVLDRASQSIRRERGSKALRSALPRLVLQAAREAGGGELVVQTSSGYSNLLTQRLLEEIQSGLAREGVAAKLRKAEQPVDVMGGAIVRRVDGSVVVDNSIEARMRRMEATLRGLIWETLAPGAGSNQHGSPSGTAGSSVKRAGGGKR